MSLVRRGVSTLIPALALLLAACSGGSSGITTGSIFGGGAPATKAAADGAQAMKPEDPMARSVNVAWTSARAAKCGFYFDPGKLRSSFVAAETQRLGADQAARIQQTYDTSYSKVGQALAGRDDYCTTGEVADIRSSLTRHLAGDFTAPVKVAKAEAGIWDWLKNDTAKKDEFDRNAVFFPSGGAHTAKE